MSAFDHVDTIGPQQIWDGLVEPRRARRAADPCADRARAGRRRPRAQPRERAARDPDRGARSASRSASETGELAPGSTWGSRERPTRGRRRARRGRAGRGLRAAPWRLGRAPDGSRPAPAGGPSRRPRAPRARQGAARPARALPAPGADRARPRSSSRRASSACRGSAASTATRPGARSSCGSGRTRSDDDLVCHELCHVWQMQHHPIAMPLSYLRTGYEREPVRGRGTGGGRGDPVSGPERLSTGAELRVTNGEAPRAVVCVNGGQSREVAGTWSCDARVARPRTRAAVPRAGLRRGALPDQVVARGSSSAARTADAAIAATGDRPTLLLGFSMGGAVAISPPPTHASSGCSGSRPGSRPARPRTARRQAPRRPPRLARPRARRASPASRPGTPATASSGHGRSGSRAATR